VSAPTTERPTPATAVPGPLDLATVRTRLERAGRERTFGAMWDCTCDAANLLTEVDRLTAELARVRAGHAAVSRELARERHLRRLQAADAARLLGAARATVAAAALGRPTPTAHVAGELRRLNLVPAPGARPESQLARPDLITRVLRDQFRTAP
jgi:hypothetical protein